MRTLFLAALLIFGAGALSHRGRIAPLWNEFVEKTREETEADLRLEKSLHDFNPNYLAAPYEPRRELYDDAVRLSEERTRLLREMREAEFGR